jgi:acid phosphatase
MTIKARSPNKGPTSFRRAGTHAILAVLCALAAGPAVPGARGVGEQAFPRALKRHIQHVVILYTENRSFDSIYGKFPGANGLSNARPDAVRQTDRQGSPLACIPQALLSDSTIPDRRFPPAAQADRFGRSFADLAAPPPDSASLANGYYDADRFVATDSVSGDLVHRFYTEQYQINRVPDPRNAGGAPMSKFVAWSNNPGIVMGVYDMSREGEGRLGTQFVLCDNAFHSAFGGSFLNHFWLVSVRTPVWPAFPGDRPHAKRTTLGPGGYPAITHGLLEDRQLTDDPRLHPFPSSNAAQALGKGDYWAVNTLQPERGPADDDAASRLPLQDFDTIGDRLSGAGVSWAWFSGGWDDAKAGHADPLFQYHHQPFAYFRRYALKKAPVEEQPGVPASPGEDSPGSAAHLKDEKDFREALDSGSLPQVSFVKPLGESSGHPGQSSILSEQRWVAETVARIERSRYWESVAIFIIPDENGGLWDHVPPPVIDTWGPGTRVPLVIVSPFARRGFVDHTQYETTSILRFIELRWNLKPLNQRDTVAAAPLDAFAD